tara:strand:+ start:4427 stop:4708 length:282 start_codon:yes stop_codon:yes gene_type:complete
MTSDIKVLAALEKDEIDPFWVDQKGKSMRVNKITRDVWTTVLPYEIIGTKDFAEITYVAPDGKIGFYEMPFHRFKLFVESGIFHPLEVIENEY